MEPPSDIAEQCEKRGLTYAETCNGPFWCRDEHYDCYNLDGQRPFQVALDRASITRTEIPQHIADGYGKKRVVSGSLGYSMQPKGMVPTVEKTIGKGAKTVQDIEKGTKAVNNLLKKLEEVNFQEQADALTARAHNVLDEVQAAPKKFQRSWKKVMLGVLLAIILALALILIIVMVRKQKENKKKKAAS